MGRKKASKLPPHYNNEEFLSAVKQVLDGTLGSKAALRQLSLPENEYRRFTRTIERIQNGQIELTASSDQNRSTEAAVRSPTTTTIDTIPEPEATEPGNNQSSVVESEPIANGTAEQTGLECHFLVDSPAHVIECDTNSSDNGFELQAASRQQSAPVSHDHCYTRCSNEENPNSFTLLQPVVPSDVVGASSQEQPSHDNYNQSINQSIHTTEQQTQISSTINRSINQPTAVLPEQTQAGDDNRSNQSAESGSERSSPTTESQTHNISQHKTKFEGLKTSKQNERAVAYQTDTPGLYRFFNVHGRPPKDANKRYLQCRCLTAYRNERYYGEDWHAADSSCPETGFHKESCQTMTALQLAAEQLELERSSLIGLGLQPSQAQTMIVNRHVQFVAAEFGVAPLDLWKAFRCAHEVARQDNRRRTKETGTGLDLNDPPKDYRYCQQIDPNVEPEEWFCGPEKKKKGEVFASATYASVTDLKRMADSEHGYVDATFRPAPKGYTQQLTWLAKIGTSSTAVVHSWMRNKELSTYLEVFDEIFKKMKRNNIVPKWKVIHSDFEFAITAALEQKLEEYFPEVHRQCKFIGCSFHWSQALMRRLDEFKLRNEYRSNPAVKRWFETLLALPFARPSDIRQMWDDGQFRPPLDLQILLDDEQMRHVDALMDSIQNTYIGPGAKIPISRWSQFENDDDRTSNFCEAYHSANRRKGQPAAPNTNRALAWMHAQHAVEQHEAYRLEAGYMRRVNLLYVAVHKTVLDRRDEFFKHEAELIKRCDRNVSLADLWDGTSSGTDYLKTVAEEAKARLLADNAIVPELPRSSLTPEQYQLEVARIRSHIHDALVMKYLRGMSHLMAKQKKQSKKAAVNCNGKKKQRSAKKRTTQSINQSITPSITNTNKSPTTTSPPPKRVCVRSSPVRRTVAVPLSRRRTMLAVGRRYHHQRKHAMANAPAQTARKRSIGFNNPDSRCYAIAPVQLLLHCSDFCGRLDYVRLVKETMHQDSRISGALVSVAQLRDQSASKARKNALMEMLKSDIDGLSNDNEAGTAQKDAQEFLMLLLEQLRVENEVEFVDLFEQRLRSYNVCHNCLTRIPLSDVVEEKELFYTVQAAGAMNDDSLLEAIQYDVRYNGPSVTDGSCCNMCQHGQLSRGRFLVNSPTLVWFHNLINCFVGFLSNGETGSTSALTSLAGDHDHQSTNARYYLVFINRSAINGQRCDVPIPIEPQVSLKTVSVSNVTYYRLAGLIVHKPTRGVTNRGHYMSYVVSRDRWMLFNDADVSESKLDDVLKAGLTGAIAALYIKEDKCAVTNLHLTV